MLYDEEPKGAPQEDPYTDIQQTQQATQSQSQSQEVEEWDANIWGKLQPMMQANTKPIFFYRDKKEVTIGRHSSNTIQLKGDKISNQHCCIRWDEKHKEVSLGDFSSNGTYVAGRKIGKGIWVLLKEGDEIIFGPPSRRLSADEFRFIFRFTATGPPEGFYKFYDLSSELGRGSFATVSRCIRKSDGDRLAVKMIQRSRLRTTNPETVETFQREIKIMEGLKHPHICKLHEVFTDPSTVYIVLELCEGGDLLDFISGYNGLSEDWAKYFTYQLCDALAYVHEQGIAHRDLKPENILLTSQSPPDLKVADFGLAKALDGATMFKTTCGTPLYLAPEVVLRDSKDPYTIAVDSWSVGVVVYCMIANSAPFEDDESEDIYTRFRKRRPNLAVIETAYSSHFRDFLERLLDPNPKTRMTCKEALEHEWLQDRREVEERIKKCVAEAKEEKTAYRAGPSTFSMAANPGSYLDAEEEESAAATNNAQPGTSLTADFEHIEVEGSSTSNPVTPIVPHPSQPTRKSHKLERRPMEIAELDEKGNLGSFEIIEAYGEPDVPQANGIEARNLKRKGRSETEDYEMAHASDVGSEATTTPVPGSSGSDATATTPVEERNARARVDANNKRPRGL